MNYSSYRITLNNYDTSSQTVLNAKQGDTGRMLYVNLMDGSLPYEIAAGCRAVFTAEKADGNLIYNDCRIENNTIIYTFTDQTTAAAGFAACEIKLYDENDVLLISPRFGLLVEESVFNDQNIPESSNEFRAVSEILVNTVNQYMEENPVATDATFTKVNWAADAQAVGKKFLEQETAIKTAQKDADNAVPKTGGTMTGYLTIPAPTQDKHPATKEYVDGKRLLLTVMLAADSWKGDAAPYTQTVAVEAITAQDCPHFGLYPTGEYEERLRQHEDFALVDELDTGDGTVTFSCLTGKPTVDLVIQMEVIR